MRGMEGTWLSGGHEDCDREWDATEMRDKARTSSRSRPYSLSFVRPAKTLNPAPRTVWAARQTMCCVAGTWFSGCEGPTDREWDATEMWDRARTSSQSRPWRHIRKTAGGLHKAFVDATTSTLPIPAILYGVDTVCKSTKHRIHSYSANPHTKMNHFTHQNPKKTTTFD